MSTALRTELADLVRWSHSRGWSPGTGGNYASLVSESPFRMLVTPSGADKGAVQPNDLLVVNEVGQVVEGNGKPSAETLLHVTLAKRLWVKVIAHTHSVWNTLASLHTDDTYTISGFEMVKGLTGVKTHEHIEIVPILENSQDIPYLARKLEAAIDEYPDLHGFLIRGHGLYTWGYNTFEARRHMEIFEFLFETSLRKARMDW